mgnify:CR=1 FL=1
MTKMKLCIRECTYPERGDISSNELRTYTHDISAITSFGAETCLPEQGARLDCDDIMREGKYYYAAYMNESYYGENIDRWKRQGCFADVKKQLGYRMTLNEAAFNVPADGGRSLAWKVTLTNDGWARPMNSRPLVLRLRNDRTDTTTNLPLNGTDLRLATPGETMTISGTVTIPAELRQGQYKILLGAPDPASSLTKDARYSIRFANSDWPDEHQRWLPDQGFMDLGVEFILD